MPYKTVVFADDLMFLKALDFRQAAGRAGRRGFDLLENVVFVEIPVAKVFSITKLSPAGPYYAVPDQHIFDPSPRDISPWV